MSTSAGVPAVRVPEDLCELDQWLLWRYEIVQGREAKVPYAIRGERASSIDPRQWAPLADALSAWQRNPRRYSGLGFVFAKGGGLVGIDLDESLDSGGEVKPWARGIVERFSDTYIEISPSGAGLKIWARGELRGIFQE